MPSETESASGVVARVIASMVAWWRGLVQTVPPDLARCEFDCRTTTCDAEKFDTCDNRLESAAKIREGEAEDALSGPDRAPTTAR